MGGLNLSNHWDLYHIIPIVSIGKSAVRPEPAAKNVRIGPQVFWFELFNFQNRYDIMRQS